MLHLFFNLILKPELKVFRFKSLDSEAEMPLDEFRGNVTNRLFKI